MNIDTLNGLLIWIATSGGAIAIVSWIVERIPQWHELPSDARYYGIMVLSAIVAVAAYAIMSYVPAEMIAMIEPYYEIIAGVIATYVASQVAHKIDRRR